METEPRKKKFKWSSLYESAIIQVWGDYISDLRGQKRNGHVFQKMANELRNYGCDVTPVELKNKIHNLTTKYKKERDRIGPSGGGRSDWEFYDQVHEVLGQYKVHNIHMCIEESISSQSKNDCTSRAQSPSAVAFSGCIEISMSAPPSPGSDPSGSTSSSPCIERSTSSASSQIRCDGEPKARKNNFQYKVLKKFEKLEVDIKGQQDKMLNADQELIALEKEKNEIVKEYLTEFKDLKTAFINFLDRM